MASLMHSLTKSLSISYTTRKSVPIINYLRHAKFSETSSSTSSDASEETIVPPKNEETEISDEELAAKQDISRLPSYYRDVLNGYPSVKEPRNKIEASLRVQRTLYGKYGSKSNVNPAICFFTKEEMEDLREYEKVAHTEHIMEVRKRELARLEEEKKQYSIREKQYDIAMASMDAHKQKIREKILKKMGEAEEGKKKRDALLEEVKRHFGYTIDPKDEKFQLMLEAKEKEQKKLVKEMKKKKREEYFMAKLAALESGAEGGDKEGGKKEQNKSKNDDEDEEENDEKD